MNGVDLLLALAGFGLLALVWRQLACERRAREQRERHEQNRSHWQVVDRIEAYGFRHQFVSVDEFIDNVLREAA